MKLAVSRVHARHRLVEHRSFGFAASAMATSILVP
jgi:hypothetical protein